MSIATKAVLEAQLAVLPRPVSPSRFWLTLPADDRMPWPGDHMLTAQEQRLIAPLSGFGHPRPGFAARRRTRLLRHRCGE